MKKIKLSVPVILAIFLLGILAATVSYYIIQFAIVKSQEGPEDPLEAWSEVSYIIWKYNSTHTAYRNMSTLIADEEPIDNASYVFQTVIDLTTAEGGGLIWIKRGTYIIDTTIVLKSSVYLQGEGIGITILHYTGPVTDLFIIQGVTNIRILDLTMEGE